MKTLHKITTSLLCLCIAVSSCDLERLPYSGIDTNSAFASYKDAKAWHEGIYSKLRASNGAIYALPQDIQADQLNATLEYGNNYGDFQRWTTLLSSNYAIQNVWAQYYSTLANINLTLEKFSNTSFADSSQNALLQQYKGEWLLTRAHLYNELMIRWAKAYNPATAASDLGVPLLLSFNLQGKPSRATSQEVYNQVLQDISEAKNLLSQKTGEQGATTLTLDAVYALEARVKLNIQDWEGAYQAAKFIIDSNRYALYSTEDDLRTMWVNDQTQEVIFHTFMSKPDELGASPIGFSYLNYSASTNEYTPQYIPSKWVIEMYDDADIRKNIYFANLPVNIGGTSYTDLYVVNKFPGNPELFTSATTNYYHSHKIFRLAELYLIAAEAASYTPANATEADALTALNTLRQARGLSALTGVSGTTLTQEIKNERFRELAFEGFRLFDLKRWGEGFSRHSPQNIDILVLGSDFYDKTVAATDDKFTWGIPTFDMNINENLIQNPGW